MTQGAFSDAIAQAHARLGDAKSNGNSTAKSSGSCHDSGRAFVSLTYATLRTRNSPIPDAGAPADPGCGEGAGDVLESGGFIENAPDREGIGAMPELTAKPK